MYEYKIDLRSDTITKPTPAMRLAMMEASVGDDVWGDDPTVNALEAKVAALFGKEAAMFCVSGTMANQIGLQLYIGRGEEVICDANSHIYLYEGGGIMANAGASVKLLVGDYGRLNAKQIADAISDGEDIHSCKTKVVSLENTMNKGGGVYYDFEEIRRIREVCDAHQIGLHLDGARLFHAIVETNETALDYGKAFDTISVCLSKGLGCPVGSVLVGSQEKIKEARKIRKRMGGGWRQAGFLAAAGIYALDNHVDRLKEDHRRAKVIGKLFEVRNYVKEVFPVMTNIVIIGLEEGLSEKEFVQSLEKVGIAATTFGKGLVRFVTHLDFNDADLEEFERRLKHIG